MRVFCAVLGLAIIAVLPSHAQELDWAGQLGGSSDDLVRDMATDATGCVYITGSFKETADFDPGPGVRELTSAGDRDVFVSKLDRSGRSIWALRFGGVNGDDGDALAVDAAGNVYVTGTFSGTVDFDPGGGTYFMTDGGVYISKFDGSGAFVWARKFDGSAFVRGIAEHDGSVYTAGQFGGNPGDTVDFDPGPGIFPLVSAGNSDAFLAKLDNSGNFVWAVRFGGPTGDRAGEVAVSEDADVYVSGGFSGAVDFDPGPETHHLFPGPGGSSFVVKLDSAGNLIWARGLNSNTALPARVSLDTAGNAYVHSQFYGTGDFDPGTGAYNLSSAGNSDGYIAKLDDSGEFVWAVAVGGTGNDSSAKVAVNGEGEVYVAGGFQSTVDFDSGDGDFPLTSAGSTDAYLLALDVAGRFIWASRLGGTGPDGYAGLVVEEIGTVYTAGSFQGTVDFDPGAGEQSLASAGSYDGFVAKLRLCDFHTDHSVYGRLLFPPRCSRTARYLTQDLYDSTTVSLNRKDSDVLYLSASGMHFSPLVVDDVVHVNGQPSGLGPYALRPGVPPFRINVPIDDNFVPLPPYAVTNPPGFDLIPTGSTQVLFELLDTQREIYGNTPVYLVRDCGIYLAKTPQTTLHWVSHQVEIGGFASNLDVVSGFVAELLVDGDYSRSCFLGTFTDASDVVDSRPEPEIGRAYYYLVRGTCENLDGYGRSDRTPDPREALPPVTTCP